MQRFEVRADAAYYTRVKVAKKPQRQWHGGEEGIARMRRLLDSGAHEVFLFNGVSPDVLPAALKQDLLARVARGKGLVRVGVKPRGRWNPPLENDPDRVALDEPLILDAPVARQVERGDPEAELFALKQGRAARLPAAPVTEYRFGWEIPDDHWQERLGRTVLWAAGKLPAQPLRLRRDPGTDAGMVAQSAPDARLMVTLPADMGIRPELWFAHSCGETGSDWPPRRRSARRPLLRRGHRHRRCRPGGGVGDLAVRGGFAAAGRTGIVENLGRNRRCPGRAGVQSAPSVRVCGVPRGPAWRLANPQKSGCRLSGRWAMMIHVLNVFILSA